MSLVVVVSLCWGLGGLRGWARSHLKGVVGGVLLWLESLNPDFFFFSSSFFWGGCVCVCCCYCGDGGGKIGIKQANKSKTGASGRGKRLRIDWLLLAVLL